MSFVQDDPPVMFDGVKGQQVKPTNLSWRGEADGELSS